MLNDSDSENIENEDLNETPEEVIDLEEQTAKQIKQQRGFSQHFEADIKLFGEMTTITQIVVLLAYIRDMIQSKTPGDIKLSIGKNLETNVFSFTVNEQEIAHFKAKNELEIN